MKIVPRWRSHSKNLGRDEEHGQGICTCAVCFAAAEASLEQTPPMRLPDPTKELEA